MLWVDKWLHYQDYIRVWVDSGLGQSLPFPKTAPEKLKEDLIWRPVRKLALMGSPLGKAGPLLWTDAIRNLPKVVEAIRKGSLSGVEIGPTYPAFRRLSASLPPETSPSAASLPEQERDGGLAAEERGHPYF